jgi:DNA polymerase III epsilon subunit-like protein
MSFSFTAIDFETTGSVEGYPVEPWQIGVVEVDENGGIATWESWLRIGHRPFHPRAPGRHEQLRDQLTAAPKLMDCLGEIRKRCVGKPLVAHNIPTERNLIQEAFPLESFGPWVDTLKLARSAWPDLASHKLEDVVKVFRLEDRLQDLLPGREAHDALYDAAASALFLRHLLDQPGWEGVGLEVLQHPSQTAWHQRPRPQKP